MRYLKDFPIILFGLIIFAALAVSSPATYNVVSRFHNDGSAIGAVATVALLVILELGAVAAKLATPWARQAAPWLIAYCVTALGINTISNWIYGALLASASGLHWAGAWLGALLYAALAPALIYLMLHLIVQRIVMIQGVQRQMHEEVAIILRPVVQAVELASQAQRSLAQLQPLALPEPAKEPAHVSYPRAQAVAEPMAAQPVLMLPDVCPACGSAPSAMQKRTAAQHNGWNCKGCGKRVLPQ